MKYLSFRKLKVTGMARNKIILKIDFPKMIHTDTHTHPPYTFSLPLNAA
jgi:hypothetical protein